MEYEVGKWYRLKTAYDWYAKFKCINNGRWVYEDKITIAEAALKKHLETIAFLNDELKNLNTEVKD
jgi:hypothetical protein